MKHVVFATLFFLMSLQSFAQQSYIQVNGEPDLSVFLDAQFKGKTTAEYNGYIIENVTPGQHLIKIVKEGFIPYEETINVKKGEVLAYKVKPFSKHVINISEQGNTDATDKKAEILTGKLIVQSVPIEIKITIEDIEGADKVPKTKDQWTADKVPEGTYKMKFTFNNKVIEKKVEIIAKSITKVFVNMITGEFSATNSYREQAGLRQFSDSLLNHYFFYPGLSRKEFLEYHPELHSLKINSISSTSVLGFTSTSYYVDGNAHRKQRKTSNLYQQGFTGYITDAENKVVSCSWYLEPEQATIPELEAKFSRTKELIQTTIPSAYRKELNNSKYNIPQERIIITVPDETGNISYYITYKLLKDRAHHNILLQFSTQNTLADW